MAILAYRGGTLELSDVPAGLALPDYVSWDGRSHTHRAAGRSYADIVLFFRDAGVPLEDQARAYEELPTGALVHRTARPYQDEALAAWRKARGRGVVVLPTGAGKTHVAMMAIDQRRRSTLVVAPTLDLVRQWYDLLRSTFGVPIGIVGGGSHEVRSITVTTYDSAYIHAEHLGHRFGLIVFDEVHHLPGATYALSAELSIAPFRLGLTATPERTDGRESMLDLLVGPIVYRRDIVDLEGDFLSDYETVRVSVELSEEERREHDAERAIYRTFLSRAGIQMSKDHGWSDFIIRSSRSAEGRRAMQAYRRQRELAFSAPAKLDYVERLLDEHKDDRVLLFTQDNATCYALSRRFLVPAITHQTKIKERSEVLAGLSSKKYGAIVTSKVLNEGVDVPDANVAIVVSGSGSVREHVQRLGRVLRKREGKHAVLYEIVTAQTAETYTSERRREHSAYDR